MATKEKVSKRKYTRRKKARVQKLTLKRLLMALQEVGVSGEARLVTGGYINSWSEEVSESPTSTVEIQINRLSDLDAARTVGAKFGLTDPIMTVRDYEVWLTFNRT